MKKLFLTILLVLPYLAFAQSNDNQLSIELRHPVSLANQQFSNNYHGVFDIGLQYQIFSKKRFGLGAGINFSQLQKSSSSSLRIITPGVNLNYSTHLGQLELRPQAGIGFSHWSFVDENRILTYKGATFNGGFKLIKRFEDMVDIYASLSYEYTFADGYHFDAAREYHLLYPGLGIMLNLKN